MATETLRPNAAGDETNIPNQSPDSGEHWDKVDEETPDEGTTYVYRPGDSSWERDLYNLPASSGSGTINKITLYFRVYTAADEAGGRAKGAIKSNSTVSETDEKDPYTDFGRWTFGTYSQEWATNPADGQPWEWSDIDSLQIGVSLKGYDESQHTRCTQVYVEVDYTPPATEKTSSDTGSGAEGTPLSTAALAGSESGSGIEALVTRLLVALDTGSGIEVGSLLKDLFVTELGQGSDSLAAKIEMPTKGGGMKLWT